MNDMEPQKKSFNIKILVEIAIVFLTILSIKHLADYFDVIGAGSMAIWCGIIVSTVFHETKKNKLERVWP
jgi:predicted nucleic acid-binding protein